MSLVRRKKKRTKVEKRIKRWKLKKEDCCDEFMKMGITRRLWKNCQMMGNYSNSDQGERQGGVFGVSSGHRKDEKET